jgi:hypothetical protein
MRRPVTGSFVLFPLVTASALVLVQPALAQPAQPARPAPIPPAAAPPVAWWTDYNSARKEAQEKGLPLMVVIGTEDCFYCRKLEAGPLKDPGITKLLAGGYVALKLDATRAPELAKALKVQMYPTMVLAAPDGKIHAFIEGYLDAERLGEQLKRAAPPAPPSPRSRPRTGRRVTSTRPPRRWPRATTRGRSRCSRASPRTPATSRWA